MMWPSVPAAGVERRTVFRAGLLGGESKSTLGEGKPPRPRPCYSAFS